MTGAEAVAVFRKRGYRAYLETVWWAFIRQQAVARSRHCCELCGYEGGPEPWGPGLQVHHLNYDCLGDEKAGDLIVLCASCHEDAHKHPHYLERLQRFAANRPPSYVLDGDIDL